MGGGGGVTSTEHVFFSGEFALHDFFWIYDVCRCFFFLNITFGLFCVFRNAEYNGSKYAHFN